MVRHPVAAGQVGGKYARGTTYNVQLYSVRCAARYGTVRSCPVPSYRLGGPDAAAAGDGGGWVGVVVPQVGMPAHVNGYFELSSNRRDIWFGDDMSGEGKRRSEVTKMTNDDAPR